MLDAAAPSTPEPAASRSRTAAGPAPEGAGFDLGVGVAVPADLRRGVEVAAGGSLADVTLHDSPGAHALTDDQRARATAVGNRVAFAAGSYRPGTIDGDALIAHELVHAAQQGRRAPPSVPRGLPVGSEADEHEANAVAASVLVGDGRHAGAIQQLTGLDARQQRALVPREGKAGRVGRHGKLQLNSCNGDVVSTYEPSLDRFSVVTRKLHVLYKRLADIRNGKEPITARKAIDDEIALLVDELSVKFGVRLSPEQLYDALSADAASIDHLLKDLGAKIEVTPPAPHHMLQRLRFDLKLGLVPPTAPLEVGWRWSVDDTRFNRFLISGQAGLRSNRMGLELDDGFWNVLSDDIATRRGFKVYAFVYLRGSDTEFVRVATPSLTFAGVPAGAGVKLRSEVQRAGADPIRTEKVVTGTPVTFLVADWAPTLRGYDFEWAVDGKRRPSYVVLREMFSTTGDHRVTVKVWREGTQRVLIGADDITITVQEATTAANPLLDQMAEKGLTGLPAVRTSMDTAVANLRPHTATGQPGAAMAQQRLDAQLKSIGKVDEFTAKARNGKAMSSLEALPSDLRLMKDDQSYSGPIMASLVVHSTAEVQPLAIHLVTWHEGETTVRTPLGVLPVPAKWHARLIDMTGAHVIKFDGAGLTALDATQAAFRDWEDDNPYPQKCTVVYRYAPPGWTFPASFSTTTTEKEVLEWIDGILMIGGIIVGGLLLLVPEPTMATKALGIAILAASVARSGYAIAQYRDLGYDWSSREVVLEGVSIVTSLVGVGGGMLRQAGMKASSSLVMKTGTAMAIASAAGDAGTLVFLTYDAYQQIQMLQQDPTLDASAREMATLRLISGLLLQGAMLIVSNRDLFHGGMGRNPRFREKFGDPSTLLPEGRTKMEMELTLIESGVAARDLPRDPKSLTELFLAKQRAKAAAADVDKLRGEIPADRQADFDAERLDWDGPDEFLDHLTGGGTRDPKTFFLSQPETPRVSGGTRGDTYRTKAGASSPNGLHDTVNKRFVKPTSATRIRMHAAEIKNAKAPASGDDRFTAELHVTNIAGTKQVVDVTFVSTPPGAMPKGPHGQGGSGPAWMQVTRRVDGTYEVVINVKSDLHATDAGTALAHELDEVAGLVHGDFKGDNLAKQQRAGWTRPTTAKTPPNPTVHDQAQVREFLAEYDKVPGTPDARLEELRAKLAAWGLQEPNHLEDRLKWLATQAVPPDVINALRTRVAQRASVAKRGPGSRTPLLDAERTDHVLYPGAGSGESMVGGGHFDPALTAHAKTLTGEYLVLTAQMPPKDGVTYRSYAQLEWIGPPPPPALGDPSIPRAIPKGDPGYPGVQGLPNPNWKLYGEPKTTFDEVGKFFPEAREAWANYLATNPPPSGNFQWTGRSASGVQIGGWAQADGSGGYRVLSVYPDGTWVR